MFKWFSVFTFLIVFAGSVSGQSLKPIDHTVYDRWESVQGLQVSNNGHWVVYQLNPQEGNGRLVIRSSDGEYTKVVDRGYASVITADSRWMICRIKPLFEETRTAKIKKKKEEDMPKDSLVMILLGTDSMRAYPRVKNYQLSDSTGQWLAWHAEKELATKTAAVVAAPDSATKLKKLNALSDSLKRQSKLLRRQYKTARKKGLQTLPVARKESLPKKKDEEPVTEGAMLHVVDLFSGQEKKYELVKQYLVHPEGTALMIETTAKNNDTIRKPSLIWVDLKSQRADTILKLFNDIRQPAFDQHGTQLVFTAERDSAAKALKKFYGLWHYRPGMDSARRLLMFGDGKMPGGKTVSPDYANRFSQNGERLFIGLSPNRRVKDTSLIDFETARLDIWHYEDPVLQPQQLKELQRDLRKSYLAFIDLKNDQLIPLADESMELVELPEADTVKWALGISADKYKMLDQWEMHHYQDMYRVDMESGKRLLIAGQVREGANISPTGKYAYWYDYKLRNYMVYNFHTNKTINATSGIKQPLWDEEDDHPDDPPPYGINGWTEKDSAFILYDRYDIWKADPSGFNQPVCITNGIGRRNKRTFRLVNVYSTKNKIASAEKQVLSVFDHQTKRSGYFILNSIHNNLVDSAAIRVEDHSVFGVPGAIKSKQSDQFVYTVMTPSESPAVFSSKMQDAGNISKSVRLSTSNPWQIEYNWYTTELHRWKMFDGKMSEGILYKPQNFDSTKKYPVILYFYERNANTLYNYKSPAPSASTINIPYFTSNGYLVFDPNIYYKNGEPGESAYNAVVSAAKYLQKMKFVDTAKMAIQGQSWGGYQVAYIITRTNMFAAAGAGAPVVNMFSAYGGIRWGSGYSRQFQYEKDQSRIGFTPWEKPDLYRKNSPIFFADKVTTPLLMTHNDKDGAVPWYQGIEFFTGLRRLGKKVWMLQYNEEDHNLVERRNRKDLSIRLAQFFGHYLKGEPMPVWMKEGVPATLKGIEWGLGNE